MDNRNVKAGWRSAWLAAALLLVALPVAAQTTTGTIRGYVTSADSGALSGADIIAKNTETGVQRSTTSGADGSYTLPGIMPGIYDLTVRRIGTAAQARRIRVQVGATQIESFALSSQAIEVEELVTVAQRPTIETRTSEVATNVTQKQIEALPTSNRNIFDLAALAPGVTNTGDQIGSIKRQFQNGAQGPEQVNVFVDGTSYKNDILKGGVVGQDRSRGNPFPRNAVQEFRVITQNYKAEYQKASSGIITATTKSGTNQWKGNAFFSYQNQGLVALDSFQQFNKDQNDDFKKPDYKRYLLGLSVGGPLIKDKLHMFASFEGNYQDRSSLTNFNPPTGFPNLDTFNLGQYEKNTTSPFRETLLFGKLSYAMSETSSLEFSTDYRNDKDIRDWGGLFNASDKAFSAANQLKVNTFTGRVKYNIFKGPWLNEAQLSFQRYRDQTKPENPSDLSIFLCCFSANIGSSRTFQDFTQKRLGLRDDITWTGLQQHTLKAGVNVDFADYDIVKRNDEVPQAVYTDADQYQIPENINFQFGNPNYGSPNTQLGVYLQDDWSPTSRLTINAGVRWDYETNMISRGYITPSDVVDSLTKYQDSLFRPLDPDRYFSNGKQRSQFKGAIQPRLGASYQLDKGGRTTIFGGWGVFYDRNVYDVMQQELEALQHPRYQINFSGRTPGDELDPNKVPFDPAYLGMTPEELLDAIPALAGTREVKLIPNDLKPPKANQFSAGVRQLVGNWAVQVQYNGVRSKNVPTFYWANFDFPCGNGTCGSNRRVPGFGTILQLDNKGKTWYDAMTVQIDRPYRLNTESEWGWGVGLAYTYSKRQTQGFNDDFSFPNEEFYPKQVRGDERSRVVANWVVDVPYVWGIQFSGLITLGTGTKYDVGDRFATAGSGGILPEFGGFSPPTRKFLGIGGWAYRTVDVRLRKDFPTFRGNQLGVTVDVFNVFNYDNFGGYNTFNRADANFGRPSNTTSDPRRAQFGVEYSF